MANTMFVEDSLHYSYVLEARISRQRQVRHMSNEIRQIRMMTELRCAINCVKLTMVEI
jgi:hypothetical protein